MHDTTYVEYLARYLVDFTRPELRCLSRKTHFCYPLLVKDALEFISKKGIERKDARPFCQTCEKDLQTY
ncbi:hypothetical protein ARALYDRAFT_904369 [Arabidopsis lyrata subsp. lyrata]|uniref:Uncharacterized protein n=1 Tax=Arabidopsis lyrata subsp. lyrata TaxID=81972 RepID=D7LLU0_ARALL|nr:hypothetical protein ARALYDRAFT_904369 [Arabidopsis lyrata subsp. lyrata]